MSSTQDSVQPHQQQQTTAVPITSSILRDNIVNSPLGTSNVLFKLRLYKNSKSQWVELNLHPTNFNTPHNMPEHSVIDVIGTAQNLVQLNYNELSIILIHIPTLQHGSFNKVIALLAEHEKAAYDETHKLFPKELHTSKLHFVPTAQPQSTNAHYLWLAIVDQRNQALVPTFPPISITNQSTMTATTFFRDYIQIETVPNAFTNVETIFGQQLPPIGTLVLCLSRNIYDVGRLPNGVLPLVNLYEHTQRAINNNWTTNYNTISCSPDFIRQQLHPSTQHLLYTIFQYNIQNAAKLQHLSDNALSTQRITPYDYILFVNELIEQSKTFVQTSTLLTTQLDQHPRIKRYVTDLITFYKNKEQGTTKTTALSSQKQNDNNNNPVDINQITQQIIKLFTRDANEFILNDTILDDFITFYLNEMLIQLQHDCLKNCSNQQLQPGVLESLLDIKPVTNSMIKYYQNCSSSSSLMLESNTNNNDVIKSDKTNNSQNATAQEQQEDNKYNHHYYKGAAILRSPDKPSNDLLLQVLFNNDYNSTHYSINKTISTTTANTQQQKNGQNNNNHNMIIDNNQQYQTVISGLNNQLIYQQNITNNYIDLLYQQNRHYNQMQDLWDAREEKYKLEIELLKLQLQNAKNNNNSIDKRGDITKVQNSSSIHSEFEVIAQQE